MNTNELQDCCQNVANESYVQLPKMDGVEIWPGIYLIGEPTPIDGTAKLRCLANVHGALAVVELSIRFRMTEEFVNPYDTPEYQTFVDEMAKHCRCSHDRPCDGVLAGGICDNRQDDTDYED